MALLDQKPRSASAVAAGGVTILRLSKAAFDQLQASSSVAGMSVLFAMIRTSSERIRRLSAQVVVYDEVGKAISEAKNSRRCWMSFCSSSRPPPPPIGACCCSAPNFRIASNFAARQT